MQNWAVATVIVFFKEWVHILPVIVMHHCINSDMKKEVTIILVMYTVKTRLFAEV